jgi:hypothetical protein
MNLRAFARWVLPGLLAMALLLSSPGAISKTKDGKENAPEKSEKSEKEGETPTIQRVPNNVYENLRNNVSRIDYYTTNYGIFGLNILQNRAGGVWPRGSSTPYIFGGGIWFGVQKVARDTSGQVIKAADGSDSLRKMSVISYNPNSGASWMVPGRVGKDYKKSPVDNSAQGINNNRIYFSTDYNKVDGTPFDNRDKLAGGVNWPIWDTRPGDSLKVNRYFGEYVEDVTQRNISTYTKGPAIISGEDVFSTYKDTDLSRYEISRLVAQRAGYPIGIQVEQTDYSWGFGDYANFMFLKYLIINKSSDTLLNCWMAPAMDMDIGQAGNDRTKIVIADKLQDTLNLAIQWSETEPQKYGYIGFDFLESPAVDSNNFVRTDKRVYSGPEQLGLKTFRNWTIQNDPRTPEERYDFMADPARDIDTGPGDKRFLMSTGPFNLRPGDTARVVVGIMFAKPPASNQSQVPNGSATDMVPLLDLDAFAQAVYDNNFLAPVPPDQATLSWSPLNNGVKLHWDERSERSVDFQERGLDFYGYQLQRQRRGSPNATIPKDSTSGWNLNWRTIATWQLPALPDSLTRFLAFQQNKLALLGPWHRLPQLMDVDPSHTGLIYAYRVFRVDTIKRPGLPDSLVTTKVAIDTAVTVGELAPNGDTLSFAGFTFNPYNDRDTVQRKILRDAIVAIMDSITNGHTFVDVGDDNKDGKVDENAVDLSQNEKLVNNVYYYYQLLAYDAGSTEDRTPQKINSGIDGLNIVRATPEAPAAGFPTTAQTVSESFLGGIHNFRLAVFDEDRLGQMFGGDTLEFEFQPTDLSRLITATQVFPPYWYINEVIVRRHSTGEELTRFFINYNANFSDRGDSISTNGVNGPLQSFPLDTPFVTYRRTPDPADFQNGRKVRAVYNNSFISSPDQQPIYETTPIYKATFGINFDYSFIQFGDSLRFGKFGDTTTPYQRPLEPFTNPQSNINLVARAQLVGQRYTGATAYNVAQIRPPSIGQVKLKVEFGPGGNETLTVKDRKDVQYTFNNVPYLTVTVKNIAEYKRAVVKEDGTIDSVAISYDYTFPADPLAQAKGDTTKETNIPLARLIEPGSHGLYAYGWVNRPADSIGRANRLKRNDYLVTDVGASSGTPVGTAGRYYLPSTDGSGNTINFTHRLLVNGAEILIDGAGMGSYQANFNSADLPPDKPNVDEFAAGESFIVDFTGGTLGLPQPGAKALVAVMKPEVPMNSDSTKGREYTDDLLDQITVVPNPYLIDHLGQVSTGNRLLYFTRLPEICTIQIYTAAGELLRTIDHQASIENGRVAVDAYDMLTKAGRQVQSQLLVARITTPSGAETIKKFAVVVGGFRIFSR